jgi:hypothetical protein
MANLIDFWRPQRDGARVPSSGGHSSTQIAISADQFRNLGREAQPVVVAARGWGDLIFG